MKKIDEKDKRKYAILFGILIIALLMSGIRLYFEEFYNVYNPECSIEYGHGKCINGSLRIPFYNPNQQDITHVKITVPFGVRANITLPADFTVSEPLNPRKTGVLTLFPCEEDIDIRGFSIEWCCTGGCYRSGMGWLSDEVFIEVSE
ncbi:MAG: hypothetical protein KAU24_00475 [Candidatus Aenigmarchaeota archaeon]|nr:hypothetical protein [Candidatus Aenigmarchaeota archaeon]